MSISQITNVVNVVTVMDYAKVQEAIVIKNYKFENGTAYSEQKRFLCIKHTIIELQQRTMGFEIFVT